VPDIALVPPPVLNSPASIKTQLEKAQVLLELFSRVKVAWYEKFWKDAASRMDDQMLEGYAARKQTHLHKTAMVLSASRSNSLIIEKEDLELANYMLEDIEADMHRVFSRIGRTEDSMQAERFIDFVRRKGSIPYKDAYKMIHIYFPDFRDFEGILSGAINSGQVRLKPGLGGVGDMILEAVNPIVQTNADAA